ncbi:MAG TPA: PEP-CTERM sorting domain-containing protein [Tepidisphaeraceae bacterium]|nr:PEP-CTERM sorting domain-containing protein [Tepidisphaeraceae bacterium]
MKSKNAILTAALAASISLTSAAFGAVFTPGDIVLYRVDNGASALGATATAVFLDEYKPDGTFVQTINMPTAVSGSNKILTATGTSSSEGMLNRSADGRFLLVSGYNAAIGASDPSASSASTVNRVVGRVDVAGNVDTTTALTNMFGANNFRSVASDDGNNLWVSGAANSPSGSNLQGVAYTTLGGTTGTAVASYASRAVSIYNGQLYTGSTSSSALGDVNQVGTGLPQSTATSTKVVGDPNNGSTNQFVMLDLDAGVAGLDTMYVADDTSDALAKYSLVSGAWVKNGSSIGAGSDDYFGLTASISGNTVTLFGTRQKGGSNADELFTLTDTAGYNANFSSTTPTVIVTASSATNVAFKGVALAPVPEPGCLGLIGMSLLALRRRRA